MPTDLPAPPIDVPFVEGPVVNGVKTELRTFTAAQLPTAPVVPYLIKTINASFSHAIAQRPDLNMPPWTRFPTPDVLFEHLHDDQDTFVVILTLPGSWDVLGTASCRRYRGPIAADHATWDRTTTPTDGFLEWELKIMAVDAALQKQGLASFLMKFVEAEVMRRSASASDYTPGVGIKIVLSTLKEMNGEYYAKRGYMMENDVWYGQGRSFHVSFMNKVLVQPTKGQS